MATKTTLIMEPVKATDNKIVFAESLADNPMAVRRVTGLYLDKRDLRDLGYTPGGQFKLTIEAA